MLVSRKTQDTVLISSTIALYHTKVSEASICFVVPIRIYSGRFDVIADIGSELWTMQTCDNEFQADPLALDQEIKARALSVVDDSL